MGSRDAYVEKVHSDWGISAYCLSEEGTLLCASCAEGEMPDPGMARMIRGDSGRCRMPGVYFESARIYYMGFVDDERVLYLLGPVSIGELNEEEVLAFTHRHEGAPGVISSVSISRAINCLSILYAAVTGEMVSEKNIARASNMYVKEIEAESHLRDTAVWQLDLFEKDISFHTYESERSFIEEFRRGQMVIPDYVIFRDMWQLEAIGPLAKEDFMKTSEYAVVSAAALMRAAAIDEGVPGETAYRITNDAFRDLLRTKDSIEMMHVYQQVVSELSAEIRRAHDKKPEDDIISHCKDYIAKHIKTSFTIREMADEMGYNESYLSRIFSESEGQTLKQYITCERLRLTANLLRYSDEKIGTISDYMGFSSQKRMTEQFVKKYGMTPSEYRRQKRVR